MPRNTNLAYGQKKKPTDPFTKTKKVMHQNTFHTPPDREIISTRTFNTDVNTMFNAWTNPEILKKWWGPAGFTNTFDEFNLVPGVHWKFTMHGPDKGNYENECVFEVIEPPHLLVWDRLSQPLFRVVVTFQEAAPGCTTVTFRMQFATAAECAKIRSFAPEKNEENFDRLEAALATL